MVLFIQIKSNCWFKAVMQPLGLPWSMSISLVSCYRTERSQLCTISRSSRDVFNDCELSQRIIRPMSQLISVSRVLDNASVLLLFVVILSWVLFICPDCRLWLLLSGRSPKECTRGNSTATNLYSFPFSLLCSVLLWSTFSRIWSYMVRFLFSVLCNCVHLCGFRFYALRQWLGHPYGQFPLLKHMRSTLIHL